MGSHLSSRASFSSDKWLHGEEIALFLLALLPPPFPLFWTNTHLIRSNLRVYFFISCKVRFLHPCALQNCSVLQPLWWNTYSKVRWSSSVFITMGSLHQRSSRLQKPKNSGWWRISSGERWYLWYTCAVYHDQWFAWWWMIGGLQVMNLCSVSWEVIHMTSRAIRGLVPNLSGDNQCISSSHLPPFFPPSSPMGNRSSETWPFKCVVTDKVTAQLYVPFLCACVCFCLQMYEPQRQRETRSSSAISRPRGVIHQNWIWPWRTDVVLWCTHSPWMDPRLYFCVHGAGGVVGLIRYTVRRTGLGLRGLVVLSFGLNRHQSLRLLLRLVAPLIVFVTQLKTPRWFADNFRE